MSRRASWVAIWSCCAGMAGSWSAVLPLDLEPRVAANHQPVDADERAIWQELAQLESSIRTSPQRLQAPELEAYARTVLERLAGRAAPDIRIYFVHDASFNAAMFPSGMMLVNTGVLARVRDEAQFAVVLAHEAGHYFRRHSLDRYRENRRQSRKAELVANAGGAMSKGYRYGDQSWALIHHVNLSSVVRFSRDQESEADAYGVALLARAGYPPRAAAALCGQLIEERRASAAARDRVYRDDAGAGLSTHPPTARRMANLRDTADHLLARGDFREGSARDGWAEVIRPHLPMLLREQVHLNDPGASLYLLEGLAATAWPSLLRFNEGEVYRLRDAAGDDVKAAAAYVAATAMARAPPEAWRARGYASLKTGDRADARAALERYLMLVPGAADAALIRSVLAGENP